MSTFEKGGYHHGDLRAALLSAAMEMLEAGEPFSLRAITRRAGVSQTAPYRHFKDRDALESALAVEGFRALLADLSEGRNPPASLADLAEFAVTYVAFALRRPALFRVMFGKPCDDADDERVRAADALHELLAAALDQVSPQADASALASAGWGLAHGLACLYLDGKLHATSTEEVAERVRGAFLAIASVGP
ncbi:TetR/AcrR family transcriptional regulator [Nocardia brasiliensis]|uniref:TetR family transcriptional regulator n=1 Tax=Nocardia brasiliensis (strain ATCC 700358 / HUJEG-1) TaxID=1133849 RepID=K0F3C4_NOCB7|nr:TetR/AcrR family transcriptional regulator [Nocardia brasiliensis]AFU03630.1 TetR family transcriptional regulator [Nocardia brasiliensis ATCC 700358]OCF89625.1 TetR family transcriptional regulator [Nocardia brasiliensis]